MGELLEVTAARTAAEEEFEAKKINLAAGEIIATTDTDKTIMMYNSDGGGCELAKVGDVAAANVAARGATAHLVLAEDKKSISMVDSDGNVIDTPAVFEPTSEGIINMDWADIVAAAQDGSIVDKCRIGEKKFLCRINNKDVFAVIIGFFADQIPESGKAAVTFMFESSPVNQKMNETLTNEGGYPASGLKHYIDTTVLESFPAVVRDALKWVAKSTLMPGGTENVLVLKLFPFSKKEASANIMGNDGLQYKEWKMIFGEDHMYEWTLDEGCWLRDAAGTGEFYWYNDVDGFVGCEANEENGVQIGFCL